MHEAQDQRSLERQPTAVKEGLLNREAGTRDVIFCSVFGAVGFGVTCVRALVFTYSLDWFVWYTVYVSTLF